MSEKFFDKNFMNSNNKYTRLDKLYDRNCIRYLIPRLIPGYI